MAKRYELLGAAWELMADYGMDLTEVVAILNPQSVDLERVIPAVVKQRRPYQGKVYI